MRKCLLIPTIEAKHLANCLNGTWICRKHPKALERIISLLMENEHMNELTPTALAFRTKGHNKQNPWLHKGQLLNSCEIQHRQDFRTFAPYYLNLNKFSHGHT